MQTRRCRFLSPVRLCKQFPPIRAGHWSLCSLKGKTLSKKGPVSPSCCSKSLRIRLRMLYIFVIDNKSHENAKTNIQVILLRDWTEISYSSAHKHIHVQQICSFITISYCLSTQQFKESTFFLLLHFKLYIFQQ